MEIAHLQEFIVFSKSMSFAHAARELFVSPPTLRTHIKQLEAETGCSLLTKRGENIEFSPAGKLFLKHAYKIVDASNAALEECRQHAQNSTALLVRTYNYPPFRDLVSLVRSRFLRENPEKHVDIRFVSSIEGGPELLLDEKADISLMVSLEGVQLFDTEEEEAQLTCVPWKNERGVFWVSEDNPLYDMENVVAKDLEGRKLVLPYTQQMIGTADIIKQKLQDHGVAIQTENTPFDSFEEYFFSELSHSFGLALYRDPSMHHYRPGMRIFELDDLSITAELFVACNESGLNDCGRAFWDMLKTAVTA